MSINANLRLGFEDLPRGLPRSLSDEDRPQRALWLAPEGLGETERFSGNSPRSVLIGHDREGKAIGLDDDRHLLTVAGSRAGKGVSVILPNLAFYEGSVLVLDPKGENASLTAERRGKGRDVPAGGMGQEVYVLDPFKGADVAEDYRAGFNPLADLDPADPLFIDLCDSIADALVMARSEDANDHWNNSARLVLRGVIAWVATDPQHPHNLGRVREILHMHPDDFAALLDDMIKSGSQAEGDATSTRGAGVPADMAGTLLGMGENELGSVLSTVRQNLVFLSSPPMAAMLNGNDRTPDLRAWKYGGMSIYLVLPAGLLHRHARFFRLFLNRMLAAVEAAPPVPREDPKGLMLLDEIHVLGHMTQLETAAGLLAGFGVRIWSIWQDFTQAESIYGKRWQTFLGNASLFQSFGLNDLMTLQFVSDRLGVSQAISVSSSQVSISQAVLGFSGDNKSMINAPLLSPDEVAYHFSRQSQAQLVMYPGASPIWMFRMDYWRKEWEGVRQAK